MTQRIVRHQELDVYKNAFDSAMQIFEITKHFPKEEVYSLTDQIRRSSRSVCANIAEAWRRRRYEAAFVNKLNIAEGEAAETQTWLEFSVKCKYLDRQTAKELYQSYDSTIAILLSMGNNPQKWIMPSGSRSKR